MVDDLINIRLNKLPRLKKSIFNVETCKLPNLHMHIFCPTRIVSKYQHLLFAIDVLLQQKCVENLDQDNKLQESHVDYLLLVV